MCSASINECQQVPFFPSEGISLYTFPSYVSPCQTPFSQTAPQQPSVTQQQNVTEYWWEGSTPAVVPSTPTSDTVGQHNKLGITFGVDLVLHIYIYHIYILCP